MATTKHKPAREHLDRIQRIAEERWGTELNGYGRPAWEVNLVKAYVNVLREHGDTKATVPARRTQILRALESGGCNADTVFYLYAALNCEVKIFCQKEVS